MLRITSTHLRRTLAAGALCLSTAAALAHEGHAQHGSHWHATDLWGFVVVGVLLVAAAWRGRK